MQVGKTPLIKLTERIYAKLETYSPTGSVKDRMVNYVADYAKHSGILKQGMTLVEATSGNTGIALAAYGAANNHPVVIIMPRNMSEERKQMMRVYGASIIEVDDSNFEQAIEKRNEMVTQPNMWSPMQFENEKNIECHQLQTAYEIFKDVSLANKKEAKYRRRWDAFVSGAGTGGTMMGLKNFIDKQRLATKCVLVSPAEPADKHGIQGINDGANFLLDISLMDEITEIKTEDAKQKVLDLARNYGLLVGISAAANVLAAEEYENKTPESDGVIVTMLCDRGERYMSLF